MGAISTQPVAVAADALAGVAAPPLDFAEVYARWFGEVARWVRALGGPRADHDDLVQDVFVIVRRKLGGFDGGNLAGWLYRITARTVRDHRRAAWFRRLLRRRDDPGLDALAATGPGPAESLERREAQRALWRLLERVGEKQRGVFVLFEIEGYSGEEIAALLGIPVATVWTRLHKARAVLAALAREITRQERTDAPAD
jgi:RNA polymerase sigma-70 factor (ECF subfamily)